MDMPMPQVVTRNGIQPSWAERHAPHGEAEIEIGTINATRLRGLECPCGARHFQVLGEATT